MDGSPLRWLDQRRTLEDAGSNPAKDSAPVPDDASMIVARGEKKDEGGLEPERHARAGR